MRGLVFLQLSQNVARTISHEWPGRVDMARIAAIESRYRSFMFLEKEKPFVCKITAEVGTVYRMKSNSMSLSVGRVNLGEFDGQIVREIQYEIYAAFMTQQVLDETMAEYTAARKRLDQLITRMPLKTDTPFLS